MDTLKRRAYWMLGLIALASVLFQLYQGWAFVHAGPRFTADDGKALCEALVIVAKESYGFQASGKPLPNCHYIER